MDKEKQFFYSSLFLSGNVIGLSFYIKTMDPINLENRLITYMEQFNELNLGIKIRRVGEGFQMVSDDEMYEELVKFFGDRSETLSKAMLETLAVIAYKQPITRMEIDEVRGVNSSSAVKALLDRNLIRVAGRKDVPGKPLMYVTTNYFLEYFGIVDLADLPTLREWQELKN
ncbi:MULTISPECIES: SMC-Scp complex subunit ScpB [Calditerrivibrio]|jgi:segregation and condensation protein B|uniref:SMC-Scp complex subunit ScpB n=1 Tax=Calditerrivibrio nitroreducens TaxID=477976 RepID=A0A2J6WNZ6_9BACT|nr:MAG: SMC-Scp complex subunit ScpB [Calditerrivibrio nitroreducens]